MDDLEKLWMENIRNQDKPPVVLNDTPSGNHDLFTRYANQMVNAGNLRYINIGLDQGT